MPSTQNIRYGYQLGRVRHIIKITASLIAVVIAFGQTAATSCLKPEIAGKWINPSAKIHELSRLEINYQCGERELKRYDPLASALWVVKAHARCARTDCVWGRAEGITQRDGALLATYSTFSAIRQVLIRNDGGVLMLDVLINYRDERPQIKRSHYLHPDQ